MRTNVAEDIALAALGAVDPVVEVNVAVGFGACHEPHLGFALSRERGAGRAEGQRREGDGGDGRRPVVDELAVVEKGRRGGRGARRGLGVGRGHGRKEVGVGWWSSG